MTLLSVGCISTSGTGSLVRIYSDRFCGASHTLGAQYYPSCEHTESIAAYSFGGCTTAVPRVPNDNSHTLASVLLCVNSSKKVFKSNFILIENFIFLSFW